MLFRPWIAVAVGVLTAIALSSAARAESPPPVTDACPEVLNYSFNHLQTGKPESLCQYRGKVVLIVNTASYCGYTHQYEGLEALYRKYKSRGLVVVGFPSNDFGGQEPGSNKDIAEFCRLTYGVEFPMFEKSSVTSIKTNPLYAELLGGRGRVPNGTFTNILSIATASKSRASGPKSSPITANSSALSSGCWPPNRQFPKVDAR